MRANLNIAVVIPWSINRDSRAKRTIVEMSKYGSIDVFYIPKSKNDEKINGHFKNNVKFHPLNQPKNIEKYSRELQTEILVNNIF